jgi:hypothetical protein
MQKYPFGWTLRRSAARHRIASRGTELPIELHVNMPSLHGLQSQKERLVTENTRSLLVIDRSLGDLVGARPSYTLEMSLAR